MSDCIDVKANIENKTYNSTDFKRLILLTQWHIECLDLIRDNDRREFPADQEQILFNEIKTQIKSAESDLILFDIQDFRFISIGEHDYKVKGNVNFNMFIAKCLFSCYISISEEIPKIKRVPSSQEIRLSIWVKSIAELKTDDRINLELDSSIRAKTDRYLMIRRDSESLHKIYSIIKSLKDTVTAKGIPHEVRILALQRILLTAGENLKDAPLTATLSSDLRQSLEKLGIPVNFLNIFRDMSAHNQVYPLLIVESKNIRKFFHGCVVIQKLIESKMIELQYSFIETIIKESNIGEFFITYLTKVAGEKDYTKLECEIKKTIDNRICSPDKRIIDEEQKQSLRFVCENVRQMIFGGKGVSTSELSNKDLESLEFITQRINQVRPQIYEKLQSQLKSWDFDKFIRKLENVKPESLYQDTKEVGQVIDHLNYKNRNKSILDKFLALPILQEINVKPNWTLKQELELYFDTNFINNDITYATFKDNNPKKLADYLFNNIRNPDDKAKKLITFLRSDDLNNKLLDTYIPPKEYDRLVYNLLISQQIKKMVLSLLVGSRKKEIVDLLKKYFPLVTIFENVMEGKLIDSSVFDMLIQQYKLKQESTVPLNQITESFNKEVEEFYLKRLREEVNVLKTLNQADTIKSQYIIVYSLLDKTVEAGKANRGHKAGDAEKYNLVDGNTIRKKLAHFSMISNENDMKELDNILVDSINWIRKTPNTEPITVEEIITVFKNILRSFKKACLVKSGKNRRYASESCLTLEEIKEFSEEGAENRDPDNIRIDGEKFIRSIILMEHEANEEKISNAIALASDSVVTGDHTSKIRMLTDNHRYLGHLGRVGQISGMVMHGMILKDLMADLFRGDYEDLTHTLGILAIGTGLQTAAKVASMKGASYILESRAVLGNTLRFASPYLARGVSAFIAWDLYKQVNEYKEGNKDALINIIGDGIQLGIDSGEILVETGEVFGLFDGLSAYTGPIGMTVGALVMVGLNVYATVRTVEKIDEYIHLTSLEKIAEGILIFLGQGPSHDIEQIIEEKDANNQEVKHITCLLKDNPLIRRYVFPTTEVKTKGEPYSKYIPQAGIGINIPGRYNTYPFNYLPTVNRKFLAKTLNNVVFLDKKVNHIKWSSSRPSNVNGFDFFCQPSGDSEWAPEGGTYYCDGAIGVEYTDNKTGNNTWISLGDGDDTIKGFLDSSNIFVLGDGYKYIYGGNKDDRFVFEGKSVDASYNSEITGSIDGRGGIDTIDANKLTPRYAESKGVGKYQVSVDFRKGILKDTSKVTLNIHNINVFLGRKGGVDEVVSACDTKHMDGRGGENKYYLDSIIIPKDDACFYNTTITVNPYTKVTNNAARGKFNYIVKGEKGKEAYVELGPSSLRFNTFVFDYALTDVAAINKSEKNITFSFVDEFYEKEKKIDVNSSFNLTISGADKNTTTYHLTDLTTIVIDKNNLYAKQNTEKPIVDLVKDYSSIADKSHMYVFVHSNDEVLTVGHNHGDVLKNDPNARASHLASGGNENIFVISSGHESVTFANLPISDVIIYDFHQGDKIDTLDLREIKEQMKKDIDREINTDVSKIENDLLITLSLDDASKMEVIKIRLKDALENNWHERLHIVIDNIFVFKKILGDFQLTPLPLILDDSKTIYVINPTDVGKGGKIRVKKEIGYYIFARNIDALVITNSLSSSTAENNVFTIILNDFYDGNNQDRMQSLKIEFDDKTILLKREIERINSAGNFSELMRKVTNDRYKTAIYTIKTQKLFEAIEGNNIGEVKELMEHGVSIDARNNAGQTPLHVAAVNGKLGIVKYLVEEKHADVNVNDNPGIKSLYCAVSGSTLDVIKYLVRTIHGHVNVKANYGIKPLHYAAFSGNLEVVKYLVEEKHADVNVKDNYEITPLHYAASSSSSSSLNVVKYLVEKKRTDINVEDTYEMTPWQYAVLGGNLEVVKYLVDEKRARLYASDNSKITILSYAAFSGNLEVVKYLVEEKHADVNATDNFGHTVLHYAASRSSLNVVKYLVEEKHADVNLKDDVSEVTPLYYAAGGGNLEVVKYLVEDINIKDNSPTTYLRYAAHGKTSALVNKERSLLWAFFLYPACDDNLGVIKYLIEEKHADVNGKDNNFGVTPIHYAASRRSLNVVKYLLAAKHADVNVKDKYGLLPLHYAVRDKNLEVVKYLVEREYAGINVKDYFRFTDFEIFTFDANLELIKYLIGKGADVNPDDDSVTTPLHDAVKSGNLEAVKYLIEKGATIDIKLNGVTPLNMLELYGYQHVVDSIVKNLTERLFDAVMYDDHYEVQNLLNQGVSANVQLGGEETLLHFAARNGKLKVVKYLIEQIYSGVNVKDYFAVTSLQVANVNNTNIDVAKYLLGKGVDVNLKTIFRWIAASNGSLNVQTRFYRQAPLDLAVAGNYSNIVEHLERKVNVKRETPQEYERSHHHPSRRLTTDSTNQPEIATSNASEKSSWINDLVGSVVKSQKCSAPSATASSNHPIRHERRKRHNDHSRHEDGMRMRTHRVRRRHRRVQKRNVKYQDSHYYTDQPEIAASSGTRPSSWINGLVDWIKGKGSGLVSSMANKFAGKELEDPKSRGIDACSVRLEKMYSAAIPIIPQSRKSQGVPKGNIPNTSWSGWSSDREKVRSNVTDAPEMNIIALNSALILGDLAVRLVNGTRHKQPIHENLLSPREKSMRFIDENMIMRTIQQGKEKFGGLATNMDEEQNWNWEING